MNGLEIGVDKEIIDILKEDEYLLDSYKTCVDDRLHARLSHNNESELENKVLEILKRNLKN